VFCEVTVLFLSANKRSLADEPAIYAGMHEVVAVASREGMSRVPVCAPHLVLFSMVYAPGSPSFPINVDALQRFSMQKQDKDKTVQPPEKLQCDAIPKSRRKIEYNTISHNLLSEIDTMEVRGSYGTKIDTLVRHLLYLQLADPGAKSIVFSAWEDSLHSAHYSGTSYRKHQ
jgi:hypothetical protein